MTFKATNLRTELAPPFLKVHDPNRGLSSQLATRLSVTQVMTGLQIESQFLPQFIEARTSKVQFL
jgi:hypothetical protein